MRKYLYELHALGCSRSARIVAILPTPRVVLSDVDLDLQGLRPAATRRMTVAETLVPHRTAARGAPSRPRFDHLHALFGRNLSKRSERLRKVTDESRPRRCLSSTATTRSSCSSPSRRAPERPIKLKFEIDGNFLVSPGRGQLLGARRRDWFPQPSLAGQLYTFHAVVRGQEALRSVCARQDHPRARRRVTRTSSRPASTSPSASPSILAGRYTIRGRRQARRRHDPRRDVCARQRPRPSSS